MKWKIFYERRNDSIPACRTKEDFINLSSFMKNQIRKRVHNVEKVPCVQLSFVKSVTREGDTRCTPEKCVKFINRVASDVFGYSRSLEMVSKPIRAKSTSFPLGSVAKCNIAEDFVSDLAGYPNKVTWV